VSDITLLVHESLYGEDVPLQYTGLYHFDQAKAAQRGFAARRNARHFALMMGDAGRVQSFDIRLSDARTRWILRMIATENERDLFRLAW